MTKRSWTTLTVLLFWTSAHKYVLQPRDDRWQYIALLNYKIHSRQHATRHILTISFGSSTVKSFIDVICTPVGDVIDVHFFNAVLQSTSWVGSVVSLKKKQESGWDSQPIGHCDPEFKTQELGWIQAIIAQEYIMVKLNVKNQLQQFR